MPTILFSSKYFPLLLSVSTFPPVYKDKKVDEKSLNSKNQCFSSFLLVDRRIRIRSNNYKSGSGFRNIRIVRIWLRVQIRNTASYAAFAVDAASADARMVSTAVSAPPAAAVPVAAVPSVTVTK
jgi:hypothetical protein